MKVGIFGGSFDPVHNGHLFLAESAKKELQLDKIVFMPCYNSPYKAKYVETHIKHRLNMLSFVIDKIKYDVSTIEARKDDTSYTVDTVKELSTYFPNDELCLIVGPDGIDTFKDWLHSDVIKKSITVKFATKDFFLPEISIRSTMVRNLIKTGKNIRHLVPDKVANYIEYNKLYMKDYPNV